MENKSVGIIAEYNPFHNGHLYHLEESRKSTGADVVVVVMSGNLMQRGQMAIADKWDRGEAAVNCGADLVVELPAVFACNSAPIFASKAVEILHNLGVDTISFGSESGNIEELQDIAREIKDNNHLIEEAIQRLVKEGLTYPRGRRQVISRLMGEEKASLLDRPNNILALEYLKAVGEIQENPPKAVTVKRKGPGYNEFEIREELASATAIRYLLEERKDISRLLPGKSAEIISRSNRPSQEILFRLICHKALSQSPEKLNGIFAGGEGLGNKLKNTIRRVSSYEELLQELKSKRYTRTRLERFLLQMLLDIGSMEGYGNYVRVLAFNEKGRAYLKEIKKQKLSRLPIITNINKDVSYDPAVANTLNKEILATDIYNIVCDRDLYKYSEFVKKPYSLEI